MGIASYDACVQIALYRKQHYSWWAVLGKTTPWPDESVPPIETPASHNVDEPIVYVRPDTITLCKPVSSGGDITVAGQQYAFVADAAAYTDMARFIYIHAEFNVEENPGMPWGNFRQYGISTNLVPVAGHENDQWLAPANVQNPGKLEYFTNHVFRSFGPGDQRTFKIVLESR
jgi:hypothetical protein